MATPKYGWIKTLFFFYYGSYGILSVYLPLHYKRVGLSAEQIGILAALYPLVGIAMNAVWGMVADQAADPRRLIRWILGLSAVFFLVLGQLSQFTLLFLVVLLFSIFFSPNNSLLDALTLGVVSRSGGDYGRLRLWGSIGFIFPSVLLWRVLGWKDDLGIVFPLFALLLAISIVLLFKYPFQRRPHTPRMDFSAFRLLRQPLVALFFFCNFLQVLALSGYYSFFSIYLEDLGVSSRHVGFIWAVGPLAETVALFFAWRAIPRWGVKGMLLVSYLATALRFLTLSLKPPLSLVLASQLLHAFCYGTLHASSLYYLAGKAGEHNRASVQGLYNAVCMQLSMVVGHTLAGFLAQRWGIPAMYRSFSLLALGTTLLFALFFRANEKHSSPGN
jgi:PPP family 3-phenylpropionic acid transporter